MSAPREMPATFASLQEFELQRIDYAAPEAGGRVGGVQAGFPLWLAVWTVGTIGAARSDAVRSWVSRQRGQIRRFYGRDVARPYPKAHIAGFAGMTRAVGGAAFSGGATGWSETITGEDDSEVTLEGLPAALTLSIGDYIDWRWTTAGEPRRALVRVVEGGTSDAAGVVTVTAEPPIPNVVPAEAVAHLDMPACVMALITDQTKLGAIDRRLAIKGGTIAAIQDLRD